MRITKFKIENFRNIRLAECLNPPDFMVICGGNGTGKSTILEALMAAKDHAGAKRRFKVDPRIVSADANSATVSMSLEFNDLEQQFVQQSFKQQCPIVDEIVVEMKMGGEGKVVKRSAPTARLLDYYSRTALNSPGFFDYIEAYRKCARTDLKQWTADSITDSALQDTLTAAGVNKFKHTKLYLTSIKMKYIQDTQTAMREDAPLPADPFDEIRRFFDGVFRPMRFIDVYLNRNPFAFVISTPRGDIDIDDMSSGEKEVFNTYLHFHQFKPHGAIILFDEADAHLHPDLERRYLRILKGLATGNQLWITTHSPEMMIEAGTESLYTILKDPQTNNANQFIRVTGTEQLHSALAEIMGSRGIVSFNQRIIFIEGEDASADREVYERLYPPSVYQISFVPAGNSAAIRKTAERVNELLSSAIAFQHYYSIVDGDIDRVLPAPPPTNTQRLFKLPVYHVENFLLVDSIILETAHDMLAGRCPYKSEADIEAKLKEIVQSTGHIRPYAGALQDSRLATAAKAAWDAVYQNNAKATTEVPSYSQTEADAVAIMRQAIADGNWRDKCKGREVLRCFCGEHGLNYKHFRNVLISKLQAPPPGLAVIMNQILA